MATDYNMWGQGRHQLLWHNQQKKSTIDTPAGVHYSAGSNLHPKEVDVKQIQGVINAIEWLNHKVGMAAAWLTSVLVVLICYDVFNRYLLNQSFVAVQELEWHLFAVIFLMGAAYTLKQDAHVRVDVFYAKASPRTQALIDLIGCLVLLIPFCALIIWTSKDFVLNSYAIAETSPDPGGLPARYLLKATLPVAFCFLLLQGIAMTLKSLLRLLGHSSPADGEAR